MSSASPVPYPFAAFNFSIELTVPGVSQGVCNAAFAECDGLEMTMDVKTIKEGGNNATQVRTAGLLGYGTLTLKRGMTSSFDLWNWFSAVTKDPTLRGNGEVVVFAHDGQTERARFALTRLLPLKLKAPPLNAKDGVVAIEEFQVAYETLTIKQPGGSGG